MIDLYYRMICCRNLSGKQSGQVHGASGCRNTYALTVLLFGIYYTTYIKLDIKDSWSYTPIKNVSSLQFIIVTNRLSWHCSQVSAILGTSFNTIHTIHTIPIYIDKQVRVPGISLYVSQPDWQLRDKYWGGERGVICKPYIRYLWTVDDILNSCKPLWIIIVFEQSILF